MRPHAWSYYLTSAKIQIFPNRCNIGGTTEEVRGWYGLTDFFLTKSTGASAKTLAKFMKV